MDIGRARRLQEEGRLGAAWKRGPGGKDRWIPTRTQALGSGFRVSG